MVLCKQTILFAGLLLCLITGCTPAGPEAQIRAALEAMEQAGEAGEIGSFMEWVAEDFVGNSAAMGRAELRRLLLVQLRKSARVSAVASNIQVEVQSDDRATASMALLLTGGPKGWLPDRGQLYAIQTGWRKDDGDWVLIQAQWEPQL